MDVCWCRIGMLRGGMELKAGGLEMRIGGQGRWAGQVGRIFSRRAFSEKYVNTRLFFFFSFSLVS